MFVCQVGDGWTCDGWPPNGSQLDAPGKRVPELRNYPSDWPVVMAMEHLILVDWCRRARSTLEQMGLGCLRNVAEQAEEAEQ